MEKKSMFSLVSPLTLEGISRNLTSFFPRTHFVHVTRMTAMRHELKALYEQNKTRFLLYLGSLWIYFRLDSYLGHFTHSLDVLRVSLHAVIISGLFSVFYGAATQRGPQAPHS